MNVQKFHNESEINESEPVSLADKVRLSVRLRIVKQLSLLSVDFFDELDDFLFTSSQQEHLGGGNDNLQSMRELRTKQGLFEEQFLNTVQSLIADYQSGEEFEFRGADDRLEREITAFEKVEVDLAVRQMQRKSAKLYSSQYELINAHNPVKEQESIEAIISSSIIVPAILQGFLSAQANFSLPLETRLVFIKLFEKHVVLNLGKLLTDLISILNNSKDLKFVEKLYSSAVNFNTTQSNLSDNPQLESKRKEIARTGERAAHSIESLVDDFVAELCDSHPMPLFIEKMIRTQWKQVLFLIGLNSGSDSLEWNEAKHSVLLLAAAADEKSQISDKEKELILEQIQQGFKLIRLGVDVQDSFCAELSQLFSSPSEATEFSAGNKFEKTRISAAQKSSTLRKVNEASISPAGKRVLSKDDLTELANLLGGDEQQQTSKSESSELADYLHDVDLIQSSEHGQFKVNGRHMSCQVVKANDDFFEIHIEGHHTSVTRSRLGLAMALKKDELRISKARITRSISSVTILDRNIH